MKEPRKPAYYIAWLLLQPFVPVGCFVLGAWLDSTLVFARQATALQTTPGHPVPVFSLLLPGLGTLAAVVVFSVALVGLIRCLRQREEKKKQNEVI